MLKYEKDYNEAGQRILDEGVMLDNGRTGKGCLTVINQDFTYDVGAGEVALLTNKHCFTVSAAAELLGYYRKYTNAQQFADIGSASWWSNSNETEAWLNNKNRKGFGDVGSVYGAVTGNNLEKIYNNLSQGVDDRGEIYQMWRPEFFDKGCLRPCAFEHIWSLVGNKLSLTVTQRSADFALGIPWNSFSFCFLLKLMAKITGNVPDKVYHKLVNLHLYSDQVEIFKGQLARTPLDISPTLEIADWVTCLDDVIGNDRHARDYFTLTGYEHQGKIAYPFSA